jgi:hypothetical protein
MHNPTELEWWAKEPQWEKHLDLEHSYNQNMLAQFIEGMWRSKKHNHNLYHKSLSSQHFLEEKDEKQSTKNLMQPST